MRYEYEPSGRRFQAGDHIHEAWNDELNNRMLKNISQREKHNQNGADFKFDPFYNCQRPYNPSPIINGDVAPPAPALPELVSGSEP